MTEIENYLRKLTEQVLAERHPGDILPLNEFCEKKNISRATVWRAEKRGEIKLTRIGRRIFVNLQQFAA
jgi:predicted DNA-binding transcriptional regulator AlpA